MLLMRDKKFDEAATIIYEKRVSSKEVVNFVADNIEDYVSRTLLRMKLDCQYQK